ncbi:hypothetical protein SH611_13695 [Geminicoccaceae bacterium 1502E]|nr:hypothetical protein [Geminicoccaceae bacterium 1502E]
MTARLLSLPSRLLELYDHTLSGGDPADWLPVASELAGGRAGALVVTDDLAGDPVYARVEGLPEDAFEIYCRDYFGNDRRVPHYFQQPHLEPLSDLDHLSEAEMARDPVYQEFLRRYGVRHELFTRFELAPGFWASFASLRGTEQEPPCAQDREISGIIAGHLARAFAIRRRFIESDSRLAERDLVIDRLGIGMAGLSAGCRPVWLNRAAEELVARRDGLVSERGRLGAPRARDDAALLAAVARVAAARREPETGGPACVTLLMERVSQRQPLQLMALPAPRGSYRELALVPIQEPVEVLLLIVDPEADDAPRAELLMDLFGLTPAEGALAAAIAAGRSLDAYARDRGLAIGTVRQYLKAIQQKTSTHRLDELTRVLLRSIARL